MRIGILECGEVAEPLRSRHGGYPEMFARLLGAADPGLAFATVRVAAGELPSHPADAGGWLVTGSRHGVYDPLPWIAPLEAFLRDCLTAGVPVAGVCFGHQVLARALGGRVEKSARGWGLGVHDYAVLHRPGWMAGLPDAMSVRAIHQDQVVETPPGATVLAASDFCPHAALAYGDPERPAALSVQAHPEFTAEFLSELIEARAGGAFPAAAAAEARASLARPVHAADWARWIAAFFRQADAGRRAALEDANECPRRRST